jgi:hypothetical protein
MSSLSVSPTDDYILPALANVKFSRVALKPGGQKSAQVCYYEILKIYFFYFLNLVSLF